MDELTDIVREINNRADKLDASVEAYREEMLHRLDGFKDTLILQRIAELGTRLSAIEDRLPEPEEE